MDFRGSDWERAGEFGRHLLRARIRGVHACDLGPRGRAQYPNVKTRIGCGPRAASSCCLLQVKPETQQLRMTNLRETRRSGRMSLNHGDAERQTGQDTNDEREINSHT